MTTEVIGVLRSLDSSLQQVDRLIARLVGAVGYIPSPVSVMTTEHEAKQNCLRNEKIDASKYPDYWDYMFRLIECLF